MIQKISIKNFKSVHSNEMELGRFNVLIGENGSGKSNILEAIAFGGAASANLLSNEFLASRGIRVTKPELMTSGFEEKRSSYIEVKITSTDDITLKFKLKNLARKGWVEVEHRSIEKYLFYKIQDYLTDKLKHEPKKENPKFKRAVVKLNEMFDDSGVPPDVQLGIFRESKDFWFNNEFKEELNLINPHLDSFLIFTPDNSALRNFFDEGQITPLGIRGEGLFSLLKAISQEKKGNRFKKIIESLKIIDWFDGFEVEANGFPGEKAIKIKDKYISDSIEYIDQRSTNEGFLFLLFYITLFVSDKTPSFFAIDNIEASFNPKLCTKLIQVLAKLAKEHKKQVIVTTHNPFILDGLNLADDDQRLFVVRRNMEGHTITNRIQPKTKTDVPLSEAWMRGYLGGLPNNF